MSFVKTVTDGSHSFVSFVFLGFLLFSLVGRGPRADTFSESRDGSEDHGPWVGRRGGGATSELVLGFSASHSSKV